jgi:hypothetical protein
VLQVQKGRAEAQARLKIVVKGGRRGNEGGRRPATCHRGAADHLGVKGKGKTAGV